MLGPYTVNNSSLVGDRPPRGRRTKAFSGESLDKDPDYNRQAMSKPKLDFGRQMSPQVRLFDPNMDDPNVGKGLGFESQARRVSESKALASQTRIGQSDDLAVLYDKDATKSYLAPGITEALLPHSAPERLGIKSRDTGRSDHARLSEPKMLLQPDTRPISHEQLVIEVKGIYAGLIMVEAKCIDVDEKQSAAAQEPDPLLRTSLSNEQWQALIALHRTLLHEHHDFFLASQHPSASRR